MTPQKKRKRASERASASRWAAPRARLDVKAGGNVMKGRGSENSQLGLQEVPYQLCGLVSVSYGDLAVRGSPHMPLRLEMGSEAGARNSSCAEATTQGQKGLLKAACEHLQHDMFRFNSDLQTLPELLSSMVSGRALCDWQRMALPPYQESAGLFSVKFLTQNGRRKSFVKEMVWKNRHAPSITRLHELLRWVQKTPRLRLSI